MQTIPFKTNVFADEENPQRTSPLTGDSHADVVIVGAGIVGLSCAYTLSEEGLDVALLEREHVGFASSGRHFGVLTPHMWDMGSEQPEQLAVWAQNCLDETGKVVAAEGIDCQFRRFDFWLPQTSESDAERAQFLADYFTQLGLGSRFVDADKVDCATFRTCGAFVLENQATVDPYLLVRGLRDAILRKGVRLYEGTPVEAVQGGKEVLVKTPGGSLRAPKVVLALNAYSGQFPFLQKYVMPGHTYAIATEPLDEKTAESIGPANDDVLIDYVRGSSGRPRYYQRLRTDRRFYFGGGGVTHAPAPDRLAPDHNDAVFRDICKEMVRRYPQLETVSIESGWGGSVSRTINGLPNIMKVPGQENVIMAVVGNGNGIGLGANAGRLVKGLVLGKDVLDAPTRAFLEFCRGPHSLRHKTMQAGWALMRSRIFGPPVRKLVERFL